MIKREIPRHLMNFIVYEPEKVHHFTGYNDNFQYNSFVLGDESLYTFDCPFDCSFYKQERFTRKLEIPSIDPCESDVDVLPGCSKFSSIQETTEVQLSMFPNIQGFNVVNYSFGVFDNNIDINNVCHKMNIPEEERRCAIIYKDFTVLPHKNYYFTIDSCHTLDPGKNRLTIFYGERINSFSFYIEVQKTDYETMKEKLESVKRSKPRMVQKRCFVYIFHVACAKCMDPTIQAFRKVFPLVSYFTYNFFPWSVTMNPPQDPYVFVNNFQNFDKFALMVFIWWE
ncbi:uncharacterized protein LOC111639862 [Centruroides sculpturatus]|uniref:uncharacterized protein LOC111639862 n=1 Tax=Centruroides sculpturatus TaxID=218467 RepID=UPI000C6CB18C|nr:uncharacterized protein LOC111639862 [Centruroides sculpturatus]